MQQTFRFANKPDVLPGKPINTGASASINDMKHVARIDSRQKGIRLDCRKLTRTDASLVIGACEQDRMPGRFDQTGRALRFRMGGAF